MPAGLHPMFNAVRDAGQSFDVKIAECGMELVVGKDKTGRNFTDFSPIVAPDLVACAPAPLPIESRGYQFPGTDRQTNFLYIGQEMHPRTTIAGRIY